MSEPLSAGDRAEFEEWRRQKRAREAEQKAGRKPMEPETARWAVGLFEAQKEVCAARGHDWHHFGGSASCSKCGARSG